jgi:hypothetical protein
VKKTLTHADIVKGRRYKVIGTPEHLKGTRYQWLNMTGEALWVNVAHNMVCVQFGGCKERGIPPQCLEEAEDKAMIIDCANLPPTYPGEGIRLLYEQMGREQAAEEAKRNAKVSQTGMVTQETAKLGQIYRITKVPPYWVKISSTRQYPSIGMIGRLMKVSDGFGTLRLSDGTQRFVPFDCMEMVTIRIPPLADTVVNLSDEALIAKMVLKPLSTLKIIKGLAKMNKDRRLVAFLDKGIIF